MPRERFDWLRLAAAIRRKHFHTWVASGNVMYGLIISLNWHTYL